MHDWLIWKPNEPRFEEIKGGSADWFALIEREQHFTCRYEDLPLPRNMRPKRVGARRTTTGGRMPP